MRRRLLLTLAATCLLVGCAQTLIHPGEVPSAAVGYVGGRFTLEKRTFATAFVLTNLDTLQEYILSSVSKADFPEGHTETTLVAVPAGRYRVTHWIVYNAYWTPGPLGREFKKAIPEGDFALPFVLKGGEVIFLGRFVAANSWTYGYFTSTTRGRWVAEKLSLQDAQGFVRASHPQFGSLPMTCLTCRN